VLVTGAARGIGRAIAISMARAGATGIVLMDLSTVEATKDELLKAATEAGHPVPEIISRVADVTSKADVAAVGEAIRTSFDGRLDAIVLNAGVLEPVLYIADQDSIKWWRSYEVFVLGVFHCLQAFIPLLRTTKDGLGTVLTVNSQASTLLRPGMSGMASAKMGQAKLLDFVNAEYGYTEDRSTPLISYWVHPGAVAHPERNDLPPELSRIQIDKAELPGDCITWLLKERRPWLAGRFISCNWE
jgi:NAD(P)-dependent dehydrogenase (short-subunit alcohol dehydrogenase family)